MAACKQILCQDGRKTYAADPKSCANAFDFLLHAHHQRLGHALTSVDIESFYSLLRDEPMLNRSPFSHLIYCCSKWLVNLCCSETYKSSLSQVKTSTKGKKNSQVDISTFRSTLSFVDTPKVSTHLDYLMRCFDGDKTLDIKISTEINKAVADAEFTRAATDTHDIVTWMTQSALNSSNPFTHVLSHMQRDTVANAEAIAEIGERIVGVNTILDSQITLNGIQNETNNKQNVINHEAQGAIRTLQQHQNEVESKMAELLREVNTLREAPANTSRSPLMKVQAKCNANAIAISELSDQVIELSGYQVSIMSVLLRSLG